MLKFEGRTGEDTEVVAWLAEHKVCKGGEIWVSQGGKSVRVMFNEYDDMPSWKARAEQAARGKKSATL